LAVCEAVDAGIKIYNAYKLAEAIQDQDEAAIEYYGTEILIDSAVDAAPLGAVFTKLGMAKVGGIIMGLGAKGGDEVVGVASKNLPRFQGPKPQYHVNPQHVPGRGLKPGKTPLPGDAESVFKNAVPNDPKNPTAWFGKNADGQIYRYSVGNDGTAHFSGIHGVGDGTRNLTNYAINRLEGL
jgi:hypothetical protein